MCALQVRPLPPKGMQPRQLQLATLPSQGATVANSAIRREVLFAAPSLLAVLSALSMAVVLPSPPAAAAAPTCDLVTAPTGLQYCDAKIGTGSEPVKGSLIRCHYTGRLASNNRVFDSSYERGRPLTFKIGVHEVIQGWDLGILGTEGVPPMKEGGKRILVIPSELAYGSRGAGGVIPPNATLMFEVELLGKPGRR
eukprot:GHRR01009715.1.p1 GENE.GHRR01009715.1~~GHRR01009715.1.p1  ORF type:complete len:196 (+),score=68.69 GHRR01009715.1:749-1336(+)